MRVTWIVLTLLACSACGGGGGGRAPQDAPDDSNCTVLGSPSPLALTPADTLQIQLEVRFLSVTDDFLDSLGVDFDRVLTPEVVGQPGFGGAFQQRDAYAVPGGIIADVDGADLIVPDGHHPGSYLPTGSVGAAPVVGEASSFVQAPGDDDQCLDVDALLRHALTGSQAVPAATAIVPTGDMTPGTGIAIERFSDVETQLFLNAVKGDALSTVISAPRVSLFNGQAATIIMQTGEAPASDLLPIVTSQVYGGAAIDFVTSGMTLDIKPEVGANQGMITLRIRPLSHGVVATLAGTYLVNGNPVTVQVPVLVPTTIQTMVSVPDGGTILLGGIKNTALDGLPDMPLLSRLPYINRLFQNTSPLANQGSLMIMVTPRIILNEGG